MPTLREYIPVGKGTTEDLVRYGRSPNEYATCSEPVRGGNVGCFKWHDCPWRNGPMYFAVRIIKSTHLGTAANTVQMACFGILQNKGQLESENSVLEIVGREGDEYETRGSVRAAESPSDPRYNTWVDRDDLKRTVTPYPAIKERYALADKILKLKAQREEEERRRKTNIAYGVKDEPAGIPEVAKPKPGTGKAGGQ